MRRPSKALALAFFLTLWTARPSATQQTPTTTVPRDPQAMAVITKALNAAGGISALAAIQDYTGSGTITYNWADDPVQGSVTVKGRGLSQFRLDATLPDGMHSWATNNGSALEKHPDGTITQMSYLLTLKPASVAFPLAQLVVALQDTSWSISYVGLVTHSGQQAYDIGIQKIVPQRSDPSGFQSSVTKADFFIDPNTFSILSVQDRAYPKYGEAGSSPHEMQFSNYQTVSGILVPFNMTDHIAGQQTASIQLSQFTFNSGLTDADFVL